MRHLTLLASLSLLIACADPVTSASPADAPDDLPPDQPADSAPDDTPDAPSETPALIARAGASQSVLVGEQVTLDASGSEGAVAYQWDFGDGRRQEAPSPNPVATVSYDAPGRYQAIVTAFDARGRRRTAGLSVTVTRATTHRAEHHTTVRFVAGADGAPDRVGVIAEDADTLTLITLDPSGQPAEVTRRQTCRRPRSLARRTGWWIVTCQDADQVQFLSDDPQTPPHTLTLPWGSRPFGVIADDEGAQVALQGSGALVDLRFDGQSAPTLHARFEALPDARGVARLPDGRVAVTQWRASQTHNQLAAIDLTSGDRTIWTLATDPRPTSDTEHGGVPNYLSQLVISPDASLGVLPGTQANTRNGVTRDGQPLAHDTMVRATLTLIDPSSGEASPATRYQLDGRGMASAAVFTSRGDFVWVALRGARVIERVDLLNRGGSATIFDVGYAPQGLALSPDDRLLLVDAALSRELVIYHVSGADAVALARVSTVEAEPLPQAVLRGKQLFNDSADQRLTQDGYVACAHCHLDGESDGLVWDFTDRGEGLRNTTSLLGRAGSGHGPIHWSGNFDEPQDFEHDLRAHFGGRGLLPDDAWATASPLGAPKAGLSEDLDALAAYMTHLTGYPRSPHRAPDGALTEAATRGAAIFASAQTGCASCHSGDHLTDSAFLSPSEPRLHDVGTLRATSGGRLGGPLTGIDTPTLYELWNSAPYLHDGRATTVRDVLTTHNPDDQHGVTSHLSAQDLDDLTTYLLSL